MLFFTGAAAAVTVRTAGAFTAFFLLLYKIGNNSSGNQYKNSGYNIILHNYLPEAYSFLILFLEFTVK